MKKREERIVRESDRIGLVWSGLLHVQSETNLDPYSACELDLAGLAFIRKRDTRLGSRNRGGSVMGFLQMAKSGDKGGASLLVMYSTDRIILRFDPCTSLGLVAYVSPLPRASKL